MKQGNAFNVSPFVLRAMMSGQYWPEGDEVYHAELTMPILLVHGMCDKFVPVDEDQRMAEVCRQIVFFVFLHKIAIWLLTDLVVLRDSLLTGPAFILAPFPDPAVRLPKSHRGRKSHGHDGVP